MVTRLNLRDNSNTSSHSTFIFEFAAGKNWVSIYHFSASAQLKYSALEGSYQTRLGNMVLVAWDWRCGSLLLCNEGDRGFFSSNKLRCLGEEELKCAAVCNSVDYDQRVLISCIPVRCPRTRWR